MSFPVHFVWRVLINRVTTQVNLCKRRVNIITNICAMCDKEEEFV